MNEAPQEWDVGPAPLEMVALRVQRVATMGPDELDGFERRTFWQYGVSR